MVIPFIFVCVATNPKGYGTITRPPTTNSHNHQHGAKLFAYITEIKNDASRLRPTSDAIRITLFQVCDVVDVEETASQICWYSLCALSYTQFVQQRDLQAGRFNSIRFDTAFFFLRHSLPSTAQAVMQSTPHSHHRPYRSYDSCSHEFEITPHFTLTTL